MRKRHLKLNLGIMTILVLLTINLAPMISGLGNNLGPELEISDIKGGFSKVCIEIQNTGDAVAEKVTSTISVKGGILNRIDIFKTCSGCGQCNNSIVPGGSKIECTDQLIIGIGSIDIIATANATDVATIEKTATGFVIGPFVIVQ